MMTDREILLLMDAVLRTNIFQWRKRKKLNRKIEALVERGWGQATPRLVESQLVDPYRKTFHG